MQNILRSQLNSVSAVRSKLSGTINDAGKAIIPALQQAVTDYCRRLEHSSPLLYR